MKRLINSPHAGVIGLTLVSMAALYGFAYSTPAMAEFHPLQTGKACMAEAAGFKLNCTANDIQVSEVTNIRDAEGNPGPVTCRLGENVTFTADVTIITTANERYDYSVYLPEGAWSAQDTSETNTCSILVGKPNGSPGINIDNDDCADISKAGAHSPIHEYKNEVITMLCRDDDNSGQADFNYCAAWENKEALGCSIENPSAPGTPSKCRCDAFDIDIRVDPPEVIKTLISPTPGTRDEPGGDFTFEVAIQNVNPGSPLFITSLIDYYDEGADGSFGVPINLWGPLESVGSADGVYLIASNCAQPSNGGEILPSDTYSCQFTVHIKDTDLPDDQEPEFYNDVVKAAFENTDGNPIVNGDTCPAGVTSIDGEHCSNVETVQVLNLPPTISVTKTANPDEVLEPGGDVEYTVVVTNTSGSYDDPLIITSLTDDQFGDLTAIPGSTCVTGQALFIASPYTCTFTQAITGTGNPEVIHTNTVTAIARDNEYDEAQFTNSATVTVKNIASVIDLVKDVNPLTVLETGDDPSNTENVDYTFTFSVKSEVGGVPTVDDVTFSSLIDNVFGDITDECNVGGTVPATDLNGFVLSPGESASCVISKSLRGNAEDVHVNTATIAGSDEDGQAVSASDDATVNFLPREPEVSLAFASSMLVVLEIENTGVENVTLSDISVQGSTIIDGLPVADSYIIRNSWGGSHAGYAYSPCSIPQTLEYQNASDSDSYQCAFMIELKPGCENTNPIDFLAAGLENGIVVKVVDDEGSDAAGFVNVEVHALEE